MQTQVETEPFGEIARRHFERTTATPLHLLSVTGALVRRLPGGRACSAGSHITSR